MPPFPGKLTRLVEQIAPSLPKAAREALEAVAKGRLTAGNEPGSSAAGTGWMTCMGKPGVMPDLSALLGRGGLPGRERDHAPSASPARGTFTTRSAATLVGAAPYKLFEPEAGRKPTALIVMLHGCTQSPDDFAAGTRMNGVAADEAVLVVYPEQRRSANMNRCWNWFMPENQHREKGEAAVIAAIVREVMAEHAIAPGRVFVAGLSAGGAMAAIMAENYPDLFAAVGIHSGLPVGSAHDMASAFAAMRQGGAADPAGPLGKGVPTIVFHGEADTTVSPLNAAAIVARIEARENGLQPTTEQGRVPNGRSYSRTIGRDAAGHVRFESWRVAGAGHAWSGGSAAGTYTDPSGPDASVQMMRFFLEQLELSPSDGQRTPAQAA